MSERQLPYRPPASPRTLGLILAGSLLALPLAWAVAQPAPAAAPTPPAAAAPKEQASAEAAAPAAAPEGAPTAQAAPTGQAPAAAPEAPSQAGQAPAATPEGAPPGEQPAAVVAPEAAAPSEAPAAAAPAAASPEKTAATGEAHPAAEQRLAAEKEVGEGHGHSEGPLVENWWSWDFGPGKEHRHPPFGFALINFVVFLYLLNRLVGKDFRGFIQSRHVEVRKALDRAREVEAKAQEQLRHFEERTKAMDAEIAALLAGFQKQAEAERQNIIARAEADAQKLLRDAEAQVQVALDAARRELEQKAALLAVGIAEKLIVSRITDADQKNLVDRYVAQVESLTRAGSTPEGLP